jgi:anaerobic selenocysteine-containing dehydrogenase
MPRWSALAWVMITENLVDQPFLDKYCVGYDEKTLPASAPANGHYKAYILGQGSDGVAKTPEWASTITGIPANVLSSWRVKLVSQTGLYQPGLGAAASCER